MPPSDIVSNSVGKADFDRAIGIRGIRSAPLATLNCSTSGGTERGVSLGSAPLVRGPKETPAAIRSHGTLPVADPALAFPRTAAVLALCRGSVQEAAIDRPLASALGAFDSAGSAAGIAFRHVLCLPFGASGHAPIRTFRTLPRQQSSMAGIQPRFFTIST